MEHHEYRRGEGALHTPRQVRGGEANGYESEEGAWTGRQGRESEREMPFHIKY